MKNLIYFFVIILALISTIKLDAQQIQVESKPNCASMKNQIILDFGCKNFTSELKDLNGLKKGDLYQLKIININMNLYKVTLQGKDSTINSTVSIPTFDTFNLDALTKLLTGITPGSIRTNLASKSSVDSIKRKMNEGLEKLKQDETELQKIKIAIDQLKLSIQIKLLSYQVVNKGSNYDNVLDGKVNIEKIIKECTERRNNIKELIDNIDKESKSYNEFVARYKEMIDKNDDLKKMDAKLKEAFLTATSSANKLFDQIDADKVNGWITAILQFENNSTWEFISLPMQHNGDITSLKICIEPKNEVYGLPKYQTEIKFPIRQKIYIGVGTAFYFSSLHNDAYSVKAIAVNSTTTNYTIVDEKPASYEIGIATLLYFGRRSEKKDNIGAHISIGPALSISDKIKPRLVIGCGLTYGEKQMISLDILGMIGYVDRKSEVFNTNEVYNAKPEQITVSKLSFGVSLALGYIYKF